jgi:hypothetical protein
MGARTNYTIITTNNPDQNLNVYAHWDGDESVLILQKAIISAMPRIKMGDTSYAVHIIVDQLTKDGRDSETGYGIYIGAEITHEESYDYKEIDLVLNTVTVGGMNFSIDEFVSQLV